MFTREFRRYVGEVSRPTVEATYTSISDDSLIKKIIIRKRDQSPGDTQYRDYLDIECALTPEGKALIDQIFTATDVVKISGGGRIEVNAFIRKSNYQLFTKYTNVDQLNRLVNVLHTTLHKGVSIINEGMRNKLLADIDIKVYCDEIHADILAHADMDAAKGKELALQYGREYGYYKILWILAEYFKQKNLLNDAAEMYAAIPSDNKHYYAESRLQLKALYQNQLIANQSGVITLTPEQIQFIREKLLELSLLAGEHEYSTSMFYDLSGFGLLQYAHQIKLNSTPETFIHLARHIAELNKEKQRLQNELAQLKLEHQNTSSAAHETVSHLAGMETGDQSAASSSAAQSMADLYSFFSQAVTIPRSLYSASSSARYRQRDSGSLDSDDDMDIAQQQSLDNSSVRNANS